MGNLKLSDFNVFGTFKARIISDQNFENVIDIKILFDVAIPDKHTQN